MTDLRCGKCGKIINVSHINICSECGSFICDKCKKRFGEICPDCFGKLNKLC